ncbi:unnamed protein product [Phytophthora lilii]|uniref:Unnamed protein product n=1 Tax=Phytophthora lilii TaxID=2077276 RepID=A0A9W6TB82_9STRA|nr:unnamed protein product [Phytophthora lilii]
MYQFPADELQLFLAKTEGGAWLPDNEGLDTLLQSEIDTSSYLNMRASWKLSKPTLFGVVSLGEDVVHVLVVVPGQRLPIAAAATHEPHPTRKKRWEELNEVLDRNKRAKVNAAGESSTGCSYVSFSDVDRVMRARRYEQSSKVIENEKNDMLHAYILLLTKAFGEIVTGKEAKRLHFIVPVLACVC